MGGRKPQLPRGGATAGSLYRDLWESSLDACFLLHCERDGAGHVTDFVFAGMNPRGAATLGLAKGAAVGRRLCEVVPIQRGDEFTVVMEDAGSACLREAGVVATRIIDALDKPFVLGGQTINVTASVGISLCPADGTGTDALIRHADDALYRAKALGKNTYQYFSAMPDGGVRPVATRHAEQGLPAAETSTG